MFNHPSFAGHEQVVFCHDPSNGLKAIIAIHDTTLGPALGGCRLWNYDDDNSALHDVLRLSKGMTYKAAIAGLNLGGGKAVIIGDAKAIKSEALFRSFGRFVHSLGGRYITAEDVNIKVDDIEHVRAETPYATGLSRGSGDPSPVTALGVFVGIKAAARQRLKKESLRGLKVAVEGIGNVGRNLCLFLAEEGVELFVSDIDGQRTEAIAKDTGAKVMSGADLYGADVDIYAPCALGATLNSETVPRLKAKIVAGAANNQLASEDLHGPMLAERNILYAPDYVINAGGLINVYHEIKGYNEDSAKSQVRKIYDTLLTIFATSEAKNIPTYRSSNLLAEERISAVARSRRVGNSLIEQHWIG